MPDVVNVLFDLTEHLPVGESIEVPEDFMQSLPGDSLLSALGIELKRIGSGSSVALMAAGRGHLNQRGIAQAGAIVALADAAAGWASYSAIKDGLFTTLGLEVKLLRPVKDGDVLRAEASTLHLGRRTHLVEVTVVRDDNPSKLVAKLTCTQMVLSVGAQ
jgi:acyl-CoA thioesterase